MPDLKYPACECEYPCSCVEFEGTIYGSVEDIVDTLVTQRTDLLAYTKVLEKDLNPSHGIH